MWFDNSNGNEHIISYDGWFDPLLTFTVTIYMCVGWYDVWCDNVELIDIFEQTIHVCL